MILMPGPPRSYESSVGGARPLLLSRRNAIHAKAPLNVTVLRQEYAMSDEISAQVIDLDYTMPRGHYRISA